MPERVEIGVSMSLSFMAGLPYLEGDPHQQCYNDGEKDSSHKASYKKGHNGDDVGCLLGHKGVTFTENSCQLVHHRIQCAVKTVPQGIATFAQKEGYKANNQQNDEKSYDGGN